MTKVKYKKIKKILKKKFYNLFTDGYIVSYPKAGRTWVRVIVSKILARRYGIAENINASLPKRHMICGPLIQFTHTSYDKPDSYKDFVPEIANKKVALLVRDPRDIVVSSFFEHTKRTGGFDGTIKEFVHDDIYGIENIIDFYNTWFETMSGSSDFFLFRYEDLKKDAERVIINLFTFFGFGKIRKEWVTRAVEESRFEKMQKQALRSHNKRLAPTNASDKTSYKVRRGKVGGYIDYFDDEDMEFVNKKMRLLNPVFGYKV